MSQNRISTGTFRSTPLMKELVNKVLDTGQISYGPFSLQFEQEFARLHGCHYAILSNSGTSSLQVALQAMKEIYGWADDDEVIVPATTFVATANIVLHNHMKPVFVDVDPISYNIDTKLIERAITPKTRVIIPVHLFGQPSDMTAVCEIARRRHLKIIEDSCETMFVKHHEKPVGSWGDIACFSTYMAHLLVTGVGGIAITDHAPFAAKMRSLVNHGLEMVNLNPGQNFSPRPMLGRHFKFDSIGHSFRITELEAAVGLAQLVEVDEMLKIRQANAGYLTARIEQSIKPYYGDIIQTPKILKGNEHAFMMYPIVLKPQKGDLVDKAPLVAYLNEQNIETRDLVPILWQPVYSYLNPFDYPVSAWLMQSGFYVGCHQDLKLRDMQFIADSLESYFARERRQYEGSRATATHESTPTTS